MTHIPTPTDFTTKNNHRAPKILYYYQDYLEDLQIAPERAEKFHYLPGFLDTQLILQNLLPMYAFLNKNHLNKEISEAGGIVKRLESVFSVETEESGIVLAQEHVQEQYVLFDIGSGRGYNSVYARVKLPHIHKILMVDRNNKMDRTHLDYCGGNIEFRWVYLREEDRKITGGRHLERRFGEFVKEELGEVSDEHSKCNGHHDHHCTGNHSTQRTGIIFGCHLCTTLAEIFIQCFNRQKDCLHGFVLAPCCQYFYHGNQDLLDNNMQKYYSIVEDCLRRGIMDQSLRDEFMLIERTVNQRLEITSQYKIWTIHLFRMIENQDEMDLLRIEKDEHVLSQKNYFITVRRRGMGEALRRMIEDQPSS